VEEGWIDAVISDNRYGLYHDAITSVFVCHQLAPLPPFGGAAAHWLSHKIHGYFLRHFDQLWVPDFPGEENLSGKLSHHFGQENARLRWLGPLSRYTDFEKKAGGKIWDIVVLLSGPEPQRSMLEEKIKPQLAASGKKALLIQGLRESEPLFEEKEGLTLCNYLTGEELARSLQRAGCVIARPGYSSLMDFVALGLKKLILVPTPGQTEQEYLARRLVEQNRAWVEKQKSFSLERAMIKIPKVGEIGSRKEVELVEVLKKVLQND
jgi:predicted glycosyltransferase